MPTRTWRSHIPPTPAGASTAFGDPTLATAVLEHITATGGRTSWDGDAVQSAGDQGEEIHRFEAIAQHGQLLPTHHTRAGWDTALVGGHLYRAGSHVIVEVADHQGRHLVTATIKDPASPRPASTIVLAHLGTDQRPYPKAPLTLHEVVNLVADPQARPVDPATRPHRVAACENDLEPDGVPCTGRLRFYPDDSQAKCDSCGGWTGALVARYLDDMPPQSTAAAARGHREGAPTP